MISVATPEKYDPPTVTLSADHQTLCKNTIRFIHDLTPLISDVEACGVDCTAYKALREKLLEINTEVNTRFCNNNPPFPM